MWRALFPIALFSLLGCASPTYSPLPPASRWTNGVSRTALPTLRRPLARVQSATATPAVTPVLSMVPFKYPAGYQDNHNWVLTESTNADSWFIVPTNQFSLDNGILTVTNAGDSKLHEYRIWFP